MSAQFSAFGGKFKQAAQFRPMYNVGALFDLQTGRYQRGSKGEWILNGGVDRTEGVTGPGNSMKSTLMHFRLLMVLKRYKNAAGFCYDTENSATRDRFFALANFVDPTGELAESLREEYGRFSFTSASEYNGSEWFDIFREQALERIKNEKLIETPFLDDLGRTLKTYSPVVGEIDSLSTFNTDATIKKRDKESVGDGKMNPLNMTNQGGKSQLIDMLPVITGRSAISMMMSAHMGDVIVLDEYNGPSKKLAFVKNTRKMKKTPENFTFLTGNLFEIRDLKRLVNQGTKLSEFPRNEFDTDKDNTDLMVATVVPIRTKSGITGIPVEYIISQTDGLQATLTEYWYCKNHGRFGLSSNPVTQYYEIYPDVKFTRNNIREKIRQDPRLVRAAEITADLCQINNLHPELALSHLVEPAELYEGLKKKGYNWDDLLDTRGYWTFDQYEHPVPYLSTKDLLEMYKGNYHPFWMKDKPLTKAA